MDPGERSATSGKRGSGQLRNVAFLEEDDGEREEDADLDESIEEHHGEVFEWDDLVLGNGVEKPEELNVRERTPNAQGKVVRRCWSGENVIVDIRRAGDAERLAAEETDGDGFPGNGLGDKSGLGGGAEGFFGSIEVTREGLERRDEEVKAVAVDAEVDGFAGLDRAIGGFSKFDGVTVS